MITNFHTNGLNSGLDFSVYPQMDNTYALHVFDVFSLNWLKQLVASRGQPGMIINDHVVSFDGLKEYNIAFYGLPLWLIREKQQWSIDEYNDTDPLITEKCCNFIVNRKQGSRYILLKMVDMFLKPEHYFHTYSGIAREFDCKHFIHDMNVLGKNSPLSAEERLKFLQPVEVESHWMPNYGTDLKSLNTATGNYQGRVGYGKMRDNWDTIKKIYLNSAVALITETGDITDDGANDNQAAVTEKSLWPIIGLNFPIWVGSHRHAEIWQKMGLDIFEDVIDHSHQYYNTILERSVYAIKNNLEIITNVELAHSLRQKHHDRLLANRRLILGNALENYTDQIIASADPNHQPYLRQVKHIFDSLPYDAARYHDYDAMS